jgi:acyl carrier protein
LYFIDMDLLGLVLSAAAEHSRIPRDQMRPEHRLLEDVEMDGDEFSYLFVPALEKAMNIKTTPTDWRGVRTILDVVDMLQDKVRETTGPA